MNNRLLSLPESITKLNLSYLDVSYNYLRGSDAGVDTWLKKYNENYENEPFEKKGSYSLPLIKNNICLNSFFLQFQPAFRFSSLIIY